LSQIFPRVISQVDKPCESYAWLGLRRVTLCPRFSPNSFPKCTNLVYAMPGWKTEAGGVVSWILPRVVSQVDKPCECYAWLEI
jgi:hypothetical protein